MRAASQAVYGPGLGVCLAGCWVFRVQERGGWRRPGSRRLIPLEGSPSVGSAAPNPRIWPQDPKCSNGWGALEPAFQGDPRGGAVLIGHPAAAQAPGGRPAPAPGAGESLCPEPPRPSASGWNAFCSLGSGCRLSEVLPWNTPRPTTCTQPACDQGEFLHSIQRVLRNAKIATADTYQVLPMFGIVFLATPGRGHGDGPFHRRGSWGSEGRSGL